MSKTDELFFKIEEEYYLSKDIESSLIVLIDSLNNDISNKVHVGAADLIRRSVESHSFNLEKIMNEVK